MLSYDDTYTFDSSRYSRLDKITTNKPYGVDNSYTYDLYDRIISKSQSNKALTTLTQILYQTLIHGVLATNSLV